VQEGRVSLAAGSLPPTVAGSGWVTSNFFDVLGVRVTAGRAFRPEDDQLPHGAQVAVIGDGLARRAFGGAAQAVGGRLMLNGRPMTIIGVLPPEFVGTQPYSRVDLWYPGATYGYVNHFSRPMEVTRTDGVFYSFIVRLAAGASFEAAQAELDVLVRALAQSHPQENRKYERIRARVFGGLGPHVLQRGSYRRLVTVLLAVGGALLLLGCANVANLLMVRSVRGQRERAVRLALGASRSRLVLLQLTESSLLTAAGATLGLGLALWLKGFITTLLLPGLAAGPSVDVPLDIRVLAMTFGVSVACGLAAGLVPAFVGVTRRSIGALGDPGGRSVTGTRRLRATFAVAQLALSLALVTDALMLVATLRTLHAVDLGFDPAGVSVHHLDPSGHGYTRDSGRIYYQDVLERLRGATGFQSISISGLAPFGSGRILRLRDPAGSERNQISVYSNAVDGTYFEVLGIRPLKGRVFTDQEALTPPGNVAPLAVVSENLARRLFGDADPIGRRATIARTAAGPAHELTVIGVTPDVHWHDVVGEPDLFLYLPFTSPDFGPRAAALLVKSPLPLRDVTERVEGAAKEVDATLPVQSSASLQASIDRDLSDRRVFAWVLSMLGGLGFVLAAVGLYGLLAQSVAERTREFGIRMAIGSERGHIFGLVIRQAAWIGVFGTASGIGLAVLGSRLIEAQLYGVTRLDPAVYMAAAGSLALVVLLAGLWPARTATRINPIEALRVE
jgi:predicted permease